MTADFDCNEGFMVRTRRRHCANPRVGFKQAWDEVQVVQNRRVVARFDMQEQALRWIARHQCRAQLAASVAELTGRAS
jgi:hypothetical protein